MKKSEPVTSEQLIRPESLRHIAIIMDGNNRWAKQRGLPGAAGHKRGVERVRDILEACRHLHIEALTLFAFSSENWNRPKVEVAGLMTLFSVYLKKETAKLKEEGVRIQVIGGRERFSEKLRKQIEWAENETATGTMTLALAVDYGGRWDIAQAAQKLAEKVQRGELRISNFLLWQCAYAELYFTDVYWPDFDEAQLHRAIAEFHSRQRRFGLRTEQLMRDESFPANALEDDNSYA